MSFHGSTMFQFAQKLKCMRVELRPLKHHFSGAMLRVEELRKDLIQAQDEMSLHPTDAILSSKVQSIKDDFLTWSRATISLMNQRTKENWLLQGDANTKLFHQSLQRLHYKNRIYSVTSAEGDVITEYQQIHEHFRHYYIFLLGAAIQTDMTLDPLVINEGPVLNVDQQLLLLSEVKDEMIRTVLWSIPEEKSPGPDGYGSGFYKAAWGVVGADV